MIRCGECQLPIEDGDHYLKVRVRGRNRGNNDPKYDREKHVHAACLTGTMGRPLKRHEKD